MPGSPPTTPRWDLPRYAQTDAAIFSSDINPIVDTLDNAVKLTELSSEASARAAADTTEAGLRAAADSSEATARANADTAEAALRQAGDTLYVVRAATVDDQTAPTQPALSVVGHFMVAVPAGQSLSLVGVAIRAMVVDSIDGNRSTWKVQTDHGHGDGSLADVTGLTVVKPLSGRSARQYVTSGGIATPLALNDLDTLALVLVNPGNTRGYSINFLVLRTVP